MDHFTTLFAHFAPVAHHFYAGTLCDSATFENQHRGHLHVLYRGDLEVIHGVNDRLQVSGPAVIWFPRGSPHQFLSRSKAGAVLVCAMIDLGARHSNPMLLGLPDMTVISLTDARVLAVTCNLLFEEAFADHNGRSVAIDRLFDYLLLQVVRYLSAAGRFNMGTLVALSDTQLGRALSALHEQPKRRWTLEELADLAGMSRTSFARRFKSVVGETMWEYLTRWRMSLARQWLAQGRTIKQVAASVGYDSASAFSRAFSKFSGQSPLAWIEVHRASGSR